MLNHVVLKRLEEIGAVLIVRTASSEQALGGACAVVAGGLKAVEVSFNVPGAPSVIREIRKALGDKVLLGAGTILNAEDAEDAVDAGAAFLIAPNTDAKVIGASKRLHVPIIPGGLTPTEVQRAWDLGADAVKIFPASMGGPAYLKALKGPFPHIPLLPTGGVDEKNVGEFFKAGAFAVGVGAALIDPKKVLAKDWKGVTEAAARFVAAVRAAKEALQKTNVIPARPEF
jgi:2-dehydro-3-deoxyphosphogluconate aldolase/(4S)-4-hydroxy-2-oxoglutarate aldolase